MKKKLFASIACSIVSLFVFFLSCKETSPGSIEQSDQSSSKSVASTMATETNTSTHQETGFEDGNLSPFTVCTTQSPNYVQAFTLGTAKCSKFYWTQVGYDGTRMDKGAEACSSLNFYKEGWFGFSFYLPSNGFPANKEQSIAQIFAENGCSSIPSNTMCLCTCIRKVRHIQPP